MHGRIIYLVGEVNDKMFLDFAASMALFEAKSSDPIHICLSSHGGESAAGLAIYGRIRSSPCLIYTEAFGLCQSAATIILAGSDYRSSALDMWFMVHDSALPKKATKAQKAQWEREEQQWADILELHSNLPASEWRKMSKKTTYLNPAELLQYAVVEQILKGTKKCK